MTPPAISGETELYLLEGTHSEKAVILEIADNELQAAYEWPSREEINIDEISPVDVERAIEGLREWRNYYGKD